MRLAGGDRLLPLRVEARDAPLGTVREGVVGPAAASLLRGRLPPPAAPKTARVASSLRARKAAALFTALSLAACVSHTPRPGSRPSAPTVKIGKPYTVFGVTYFPADDRGYDERGLASWYGPGFHALSTANGERYDQDGITAAHKTLPMPSYVEVENLDNGRRLTVRLNDRGPFVAGRIIDLSRRSAQLLGVDRPGTARVRVRRVFPDGATLAALAPPPAAVVAAVPAAPLPPGSAPAAVLEAAVPDGAARDGDTRGRDARDGGPAVAVAAVATVAVPGAATAAQSTQRAPATAAAPSFVQVAALADAGKAAWLKGYLSAFGPVVTQPTAAGLTRVRLGPYAARPAADAALAQVRAAGYTDAHIVATPAARP